MRSIVALALASAAMAMPLSLLKHRERSMRPSKLVMEQAEPPAQWFEQRQDHFDWNPESTWRQRFWTNSTFCKQDGCPVFLYVGGEGALNGFTVVEGSHVEYAETYGAFIVALEHRFYGGSLPTGDLSDESLRLLSSQQALADLANFVSQMQSSWGPNGHTNQPGKLVTFGGSYPGALSAFARLKYPNVVHAAVSTSSPVEAEYDFNGYCQVVTEALSANISGGSSKCLSATQAAFSQMRSALHGSDTKLSELSQLLQSCQPLEPTTRDRFAVVSQWAGEVMGLVQYNKLSLPAAAPGLNVARYCQAMTAAKSGSELPTLVATLLQGSSQCVQNSWNEQMQVILNTTADPSATGVGARQWTWQTATQFAYYQSCEAGCPFAADMDLSGYADQVAAAFNVTPTQTMQAVDFSLAYYGGNTTAADRVFFVNGGLDPWHRLSVQHQLPTFQDVRTLVIDGTSHCRQMYPSSPSDPPQVTAARKQISSALGDWLSSQ